MTVTIKDIAKRAGVSVTTVSRVLNNSGYVSKEARTAVEEAIKELDYVPNAMAKSLPSRGSSMVGTMIPEVGNPFFAGVIAGVTNICDQKNYSLMLCNANESAARERRYLRSLREQRIAGLIIASTADETELTAEHIGAIKKMKCPIVMLDRQLPYIDYEGVYTDDETPMTELMTLLLKEGHRNIAYLAGNLYTSTGRSRYKGVQKAFENAGLTLPEENVFPSIFSSKEGFALTQKILSRPKEEWPTAIVVANNTIAMGALHSLYTHNVRIPRDMAFAGYDRLEVMEQLQGNLTLVEKDGIEIGEIAMRRLFARMENDPNEPAGDIIIRPKLIVRGSEKMPVR